MTTTNSNLPAQPGTGTAIAKAKPGNGQLQFPRVDLAQGIDEIPDIDNVEPLEINLMSEYWTPEKPGEMRNMFFTHLSENDYPNQTIGEVKRLVTANFLHPRVIDGKKEMVPVSNASARLVGKLQEYVNTGMIGNGSALRIVYKGKEKNKTNANMSDAWDVKPIPVGRTPVADEAEETAHVVE